MTATLDIATAFLAEAKVGIDHHTLTTAEIEAYIETARKMIQACNREVRHRTLVAAAKEAQDTLDHLEKVRRLVSYGVAHGRFDGTAIQFCELMATRPAIDRTRGIRGIAPAFEWLRANRTDLAAHIRHLIPSND
jgi:hypothetical protein